MTDDSFPPESIYSKIISQNKEREEVVTAFMDYLRQLDPANQKLLSLGNKEQRDSIFNVFEAGFRIGRGS